jgi:hypothetical protein
VENDKASTRYTDIALSSDSRVAMHDRCFVTSGRFTVGVTGVPTGIFGRLGNVLGLD